MWNTCAGRVLMVILVCIILDILAYAVVEHDAVPLSTPVSLAVGKFRSPRFFSFTPEPYRVNIDIPSSGIATDPVRANWILRSGGAIIARGTSDANLGHGFRGSDETLQEIGCFTSEAFGIYDFDVDFMNDNSRLDGAKPRLDVEGDFEGVIFLKWCFIILGAVLAVLFGTGLGLAMVIKGQAILQERKSRSG